MGISQNAIICGDNILQYIPQRHPIVMVDKFLGIQNNISYSALSITEDNIFCQNGELSECGLIEHIAQSAALRMGYLCKTNGEDIALGYIGSVNNFMAFHLPKVGDSLDTNITIEHEVMGITLISAKVYCNDTLFAECKMKIFLDNK